MRSVTATRGDLNDRTTLELRAPPPPTVSLAADDACTAL